LLLLSEVINAKIHCSIFTNCSLRWYSILLSSSDLGLTLVVCNYFSHVRRQHSWGAVGIFFSQICLAFYILHFHVLHFHFLHFQVLLVSPSFSRPVSWSAFSRPAFSRPVIRHCTSSSRPACLRLAAWSLFLRSAFHVLHFQSTKPSLSGVCFSWKRVLPFGGFVDTAPHFRSEIPWKPQFWGVNMRLQAKRAKYWQFHVIETTASISTKFCTTIETTKWVVPIGAQQIQAGGRPPFWKKR